MDRGHDHNNRILALKLSLLLWLSPFLRCLLTGKILDKDMVGLGLSIITECTSNPLHVRNFYTTTTARAAQAIVAKSQILAF